MSEPMSVTVEVWPVAADDAGVWLLSGDDAWRWARVDADSDVHWEISLLLSGHGIHSDDVMWLHSTSWRPDGPAIVLTYMAAVKAGTIVRHHWPDAVPVTPAMADAVGKPPTHGAAEVPVPRLVDVPIHGLGHMKDQIAKNATTREALGGLWRVQLEPFEETLAGLYQTPHRAVA